LRCKTALPPAVWVAKPLESLEKVDDRITRRVNILSRFLIHKVVNVVTDITIKRKVIVEDIVEDNEHVLVAGILGEGHQ